jgi:hypothetical protein
MLVLSVDKSCSVLRESMEPLGITIAEPRLTRPFSSSVVASSLTLARLLFNLLLSDSVSLEAPSTRSFFGLTHPRRSCFADLAIITSLYLSFYNIGSALGNTISGALWTQILPGKLNAQLGNDTLASLAYGSPFTFIIDYTWETVERQQVVRAYGEIQKILCITGLCLSLPLLVCTLVVRNPVLGKEQSLKDAEADATVQVEKRHAEA